LRDDGLSDQPEVYSKSGQLSGLALVEQLYLRSGSGPAQQHLERLLSVDQSSHGFSLCDVGQPALGINILPSDDMDYESFSPPPSWNAIYSVNRVRFGHKPKTDFISHAGEELIIPTQGEVAFHFFWSPGGSRVGRFLLTPAVAEGQMLRINPQIPHHAWAATKEAAAWVVFRHALNSPIAAVIEQDSLAITGPQALRESPAAVSSVVQNLHRRRFDANTLSKSGTYAMIAWGISQMIREARLKAGLTPTDLARQACVDPSSISRLEEARANVSVELLSKVCNILRIGMSQCVESGSWVFERNSIETQQLNNEIVRVPAGHHYLHSTIVRLAKNEQKLVPTGSSVEPEPLSSWIILSGRLLLELPQVMNAKSIVLETGNVLHFRKNGEVKVHALSSATFVRISYSRICECNGKDANIADISKAASAGLP
jgi:transcriptional regulator with XRE-family HTH domain